MPRRTILVKYSRHNTHSLLLGDFARKEQMEVRKAVGTKRFTASATMTMGNAVGISTSKDSHRFSYVEDTHDSVAIWVRRSQMSIALCGC